MPEAHRKIRKARKTEKFRGAEAARGSQEDQEGQEDGKFRGAKAARKIFLSFGSSCESLFRLSQGNLIFWRRGVVAIQ